MQRHECLAEDRSLIETALDVLRRNHDRVHWNHTVGCAVRCGDGRVFAGVNCDGIHGACAEYITIGMAVSAGARAFDTIVAVEENHPNRIISPCGNCRQMLFEYCPDILVIVNDEDGHPIKVRARDLLPFPSV